jgi:hypothetical protein
VQRRGYAMPLVRRTHKKFKKAKKGDGQTETDRFDIEFKKQPSKYDKKNLDAAAEWDQQAAEIKAGTRRNIWDILEERGFVKDTAG